MREVLSGFGVIVIAAAIVIGICMWAKSDSKKELDEGFKKISADYTSFSVQGERFKVKDIKSVQSVTVPYSQDFYKIYMNDGTFITVGEYDMIWYK